MLCQEIHSGGKELLYRLIGWIGNKDRIIYCEYRFPRIGLIAENIGNA